MKKLSIAVFAALTAFGAFAAHADPIVDANNQITFQLGTHYIDYREIDSYGATGTDTLNTERGNMATIAMGVSRQGTVLGVTDVYLSGRGQYWKGVTDYNGYLQSMDGSTALIPFKNTTDNITSELALKAGRTFKTDNLVSGSALTPYAAYGYRSWDRTLTGEYGYKEAYKHHSVGAGVLAQYAASDKMVLSADYSAGKIISAKMKMADAVDFDLKSRSYQALGLGVDYAVDKQIHFSFGVTFNKFKYGESDVVAGFISPNSKTTERNVFVGAGYAF